MVLVAGVTMGWAAAARSGTDSSPPPDPACNPIGSGFHRCIQNAATNCQSTDQAVKATIANSKKCWLYVTDSLANTPFYQLKLEDWTPFHPEIHSQCDPGAMANAVTKPQSIRDFECQTVGSVPTSVTAKYETDSLDCRSPTASIQPSVQAKRVTHARRPRARHDH
jgi:hypothetical protein